MRQGTMRQSFSSICTAYSTRLHRIISNSLTFNAGLEPYYARICLYQILASSRLAVGSIEVIVFGFLMHI